MSPKPLPPSPQARRERCGYCGAEIFDVVTEAVPRAPWANPSGFNAGWKSPGATTAKPCGHPYPWLEINDD